MQYLDLFRSELRFFFINAMSEHEIYLILFLALYINLIYFLRTSQVKNEEYANFLDFYDPKLEERTTAQIEAANFSKETTQKLKITKAQEILNSCVILTPESLKQLREYDNYRPMPFIKQFAGNLRDSIRLS